MKLLEDYFGQKLFERPGRRVEPTPSAIALLEDVRAAFDHIALASAQLTRRGVRRVLTVNAAPSFAMRWLIPRIAGFQRAHPNLELRVVTAPVEGISRLDGPYDIVIRREQMSRAGYACRLLFEDCSMPVMHPKLRGGERLTSPQQLAGLVLLHVRSSPDAWRRWFSEHASAPIETIDGPFLDDSSFALQAALSGVGVALVPQIFAAEDLAAGRLIAPFPHCTLNAAGFFTLFRETAPHERGTRELLRWLDLEAEASAVAAGSPSAARRASTARPENAQHAY